MSVNAKTMNASDVRKDWGNFIDNIVRTKPQFVKRSRDNIFALSVDLLKDVLSIYPENAKHLQVQRGASREASRVYPENAKHLQVQRGASREASRVYTGYASCHQSQGLQRHDVGRLPDFLSCCVSQYVILPVLSFSPSAFQTTEADSLQEVFLPNHVKSKGWD